MPAEFQAVARADQIQDGQMMLLTVEGKDVLLVRAGGEFFAVDSVCTHAMGYLDEGSLEGCEIICPLHSGRFDLRTGAALWGPPVDPLTTYEVRIDGDEVLIRLQNG
jgi:3-phenylpropionate/trans-cinnamate dioxygenase ferredoxin component